MILQAVIVKNGTQKIKQIKKSGCFYAEGQAPENICHEMRFYKNEEAAKNNYPKLIKCIFHLILDTDNMNFFSANRTPVRLKSKFRETDIEYIFTFDEGIKDLHYYDASVIDEVAASTLKITTTKVKEETMDNATIVRKMIELSKLIDYEPTNISFLKDAMHCQIIHKIGDGKNRKNYTNDSYATLGDAILKFILTEYLFDKGCDKAEITQRKQTLEDNSTLFNLCNACGIFRYAYNDLYFSDMAPFENQVYHSTHDVYIEAIIAAIYKDKGFDYCKKWIISFFQRYNILFD